MPDSQAIAAKITPRGWGGTPQRERWNLERPIMDFEILTVLSGC